MTSPFPGMNPFLERRDRWSSFHGWFLYSLAELHLQAAQELGCWLDVEKDVYARADDGRSFLVGAPDAYVSAASETAVRASRAATREPAATHSIELRYREGVTHEQNYLVVRENNTYNNVLAVVELLSPANKRGPDGARYRRKRRQIIESRTNFLEIDLLRAGRNISRLEFPELSPAPYFLFRARKLEWKWDFEAFPLRLQDRLPTIGLPLGVGRSDLMLDLAATFDRAYGFAVRPGSIDYQHEAVPSPKLNEEDETWLKQVTGHIE